VGRNQRKQYTPFGRIQALFLATLVGCLACTGDAKSALEHEEVEQRPEPTASDYIFPTEPTGILVEEAPTPSHPMGPTKTGLASPTNGEPPFVQVPVPVPLAVPVLAPTPKATLDERPMAGAADTSLRRFRLEVTILPSGLGRINAIPSSEDQTYSEGTVVNVTARCDVDFLTWAGDLPEGVSPLLDSAEVMLDRDRLLFAICTTPAPTATPTPIPPPPPTPPPTRAPIRLSINGTFVGPGQVAVPVSGGTIMVHPSPRLGGEYDRDREVTLGAYPHLGGSQIRWTGPDWALGPISRLTMSSVRRVLVKIIAPSGPVSTPVATITPPLALPTPTPVLIPTPTMQMVTPTLLPPPTSVPTAVPIPVPAVQASTPGNSSTVVSADTPKNIPDPGQVSSTLSFPTSGPILDMTLDFRLTHACERDLIIDFIHPDGAYAVVMNRGNEVCQGAPTQIHGGGNIWGPLFVDKDAAGTWTLVVKDDSPGHTGTLNYWSLDITVGPGYAPAAVSDLIASVSQELVDTCPTPWCINLNWTAPGDDGNSGTAASYDIRYSTSLITEGNWLETSIGVPSSWLTPAAPGSREGATITGLTEGTTYYFALKVLDEAGNTSAVSNVPSWTAGPP